MISIAPAGCRINKGHLGLRRSQPSWGPRDPGWGQNVLASDSESLTSSGLGLRVGLRRQALCLKLKLKNFAAAKFKLTLTCTLNLALALSLSLSGWQAPPGPSRGRRRPGLRLLKPSGF